jgi:hypothetical protein
VAWRKGRVERRRASTGPQRTQERVSREVFHELVMLPRITIFGNLQYKVDGSRRHFDGTGRQCGLWSSIFEDQNAL